MDRKKLTNTGEMIMKNDLHGARGQDYGRGPNRGPNFINTFSSRMPTETELKQAQQSLALLKQQIRTTGGDGFAYEPSGYQASPNRGVMDQMRRPPQARGNATLENIERKEKMLMDKIDRLNDGLNMEEDHMRRNGYNGGKASKNDDEYYRGNNNNRMDHMNNMKRAPAQVQSFPEEDRRPNNRRPNNGYQRAEEPTDNRRNASPITNTYDRMNLADDKRFGQAQPQTGGYRTKFSLDDDRPVGQGASLKNKPSEVDDEKASAFGHNKANRFNEDAPIGGGNNKYKFNDAEEKPIGGQPPARRPAPARGQSNLQEEERPMPGARNGKGSGGYETGPGRGGRAEFNDDDFAPPARNNRQNHAAEERQAGGAGNRNRPQQNDFEDHDLAEQQNKNSRRNPNAGLSSKKPAPKSKYDDEADPEDDDRPLKDKDMNQIIKEAAQNDKFEDVFECPEGCGRSFKQDALEKHIKICKKVFQTKRKKFDETAMRLEGIADPNLIKQVKKKVAMGPAKETKPSSKAAGWKAQSEAFRAQIRSAAGGTMTKEQEAAVHEVMNAGLVPCPSCGRTFGEKAAKAHIPSCEQRSKANQYKKAASTTSSKNVPAKGKR